MLAGLPGGRGTRRGWPEQPACSHLRRHAHGRLHVAAVGAVLAGDIEGGAVIDRRADDGYSQRDVDCPLEVDELHRDMSLVVVHRDDEVEFLAQAANKNRVRRVWPGAIEAKPPRLFDRRRNDLRILPAE